MLQREFRRRLVLARFDRDGVIERAVAAAEAGRGRDGFTYIGARAHHRIFQTHLLGEASSDGRRQCATGAVRVAAFYARILETVVAESR